MNADFLGRGLNLHTKNQQYRNEKLCNSIVKDCKKIKYISSRYVLQTNIF